MKKIKYLLAFLALLPFSSTFAQEGEIIYRDFEPDTCKYITWSLYGGGMDSLKIDLDLDGSIDFWVTGFVQHGALLPNAYVSDGWGLCYPEENTVLNNDTITWSNDSFWPDGCFSGRYGFRKQQNGNYYYGWMIAYCDMKPTKSNNKNIGRNVYIDKFAYCTVPNYPLVWGQIEFWDIEENKGESFGKLHPNPTTGIVRIEGENASEVQVFNALGQLVKTVQNTNEVSLEGLPQGVYLLRVTLEGGKVFSDKVVKE